MCELIPYQDDHRDGVIAVVKAAYDEYGFTWDEDGYHRDLSATNSGVNRIEGNHATLNGRDGFAIDRSFVLRNSSNLNGNSNYKFAGDPNFGPVGQVLTATNAFTNFQ